MKIKYYIIILVCALSLVLPSVGGGRAFAAEDDAPNSDEFTSEMELLMGLGFLDIDSVSAGDIVTRGDAAVVLANILSPSRTGQDTSTEFVDVMPEYYASEAISVVAANGWMGRSDDGKFYPSAPLTNTELLCILVRMTGYAREAERNGGYPQGYLRAANIAGMKKLSISDSSVTFGEFCARLTEALETKLMLTEYGNGDSSYISDKSYLEENLSVYRGYGRVTATDKRHFYGDVPADDGSVVIDGREYKTSGIADAEKYLGFRTEFYYKDEDGERTLVYIRKQNGANKTLTVTSDDIISAGKDGIEYYLNNKKHRAELSAKADILCNGQAVAEMPSPFDYDFAVIELAASGSGGYDFVDFMGYNTYVVQSYLQDSGDLYGKYNSGSLNLDDNITELCMRDTMGNELELSVIKSGDVLSVAESEDGEHINILCSTLQISGEVDTVSDESVTADNTEYEFVGEARNNISKISAGTGYVFYIDSFGKIADWKEESNTNRKYAYLTKIAGDEWSGISVRLFEETGRFDTKKLADKVWLDGAVIRTDAGTEAFKKTLLKDSRIDQLIVYSMNGDGEINYIDTSKRGADENENTLTNIFNNFSNRIGSSSTRLKYSTATRLFSGKVLIDDNLKVFFVPIDADTADEAFFEIKTISRYQQDRQYSLDCYKVNSESFVSEVIVEYISTKRELDSTSPGLFLVNEITEGLNSSGEAVKILKGFGPKGAESSVVLDSDVDINSVKFAATDETGRIEVGDVVRYKTNPLGDAIYMELYFDESERKLLTANNPSTGTSTGIAYSDQHRFIWGNVYNRLGDTAMVVTDDLPLANNDISSASWWEYQVLGKSAVFLFDISGKTPQFVRISSEEVLDYVHSGEDYMQVLAYTYWGDANTVIAYGRKETK